MLFLEQGLSGHSAKGVAWGWLYSFVMAYLQPWRRKIEKGEVWINPQV